MKRNSQEQLKGIKKALVDLRELIKVHAKKEGGSEVLAADLEGLAGKYERAMVEILMEN